MPRRRDDDEDFEDELGYDEELPEDWTDAQIEEYNDLMDEFPDLDGLDELDTLDEDEDFYGVK